MEEQTLSFAKRKVFKKVFQFFIFYGLICMHVDGFYIVEIILAYVASRVAYNNIKNLKRMIKSF